MKNIFKKLAACLQTAAILSSFSGMQAAQAETVPNGDPYAYAQYYLQDTGVASVWNNPFRTPSSEKVKIAIFDNGFDLNQEDMIEQWSSVSRTLYTRNLSFGYREKYLHGSDVASVIAMKHNNNIGGIGICPNVELYPFDYYEWNFSQVVDYCIQNDIYLINMSFLSWSPGKYTESVLKRYEDFGGIIINGCGNTDMVENDNPNNDVVPIFPGNLSQNYSNILSVTGSRNGKFPMYYNTDKSKFHYGKNSVTLAAPAEDMLVPAYTDEYYAQGGTSESAPYVTGVMALLKSYFPSATMMQIKDAVLNTVDQEISFKDRCTTCGVVNAERAFYYLEEQLEPDNVHIQEGVYYIKNTCMNQYMTSTSADQYGEVRLSDYTGNSNQKWTVEFTDGYYVIRPYNNYNVSLDIWNAYMHPATQVWQYQYTGADCQKWKLAKKRRGYQIQSKVNSGYSLDYDYNKKTAIYATGDSLSEQWEFEKAADVSGTYFIKNNYSSKYITSPGSSSAEFTNLNDKCNSDASKWNIVPLNNGYYKIVSESNPSQCLEVYYAINGDRTAVWQLAYGGYDCQQWKITMNQDGSYRIASKLDDKMLLNFNTAPVESGTYNNTLCISNSESGKSVSSWTLEKVETVLDGKSLRSVNVGGVNRDLTIEYIGNGEYVFNYNNQRLELGGSGNGDIDHAVSLANSNDASEDQVWRIRKINDGYYIIPHRYQCTALDTHTGMNNWLTTTNAYNLYANIY